MYGAILGDIIGSAFEFDRGGKTKKFPLFCEESTWTDDTVMTIAVAEVLMAAGRDATVEEIKAACVKSMQKWGRKYPYAGYGGRFINWVHSDDPHPYKSYGNGSAMRVSAAGWLYDTIERTREVARATAAVTHNHPEGIKGAECTAAVIFMARNGATDEDIAEYVKEEFGYDFSETLEEMRARHDHVETCMDSLPKAMRAYLDGTSYEDVVRNAVSLGGDTDTLGAIAGAMAEGRYRVPEDLKKECQERVPKDMRKVIDRFDDLLERIYSNEKNEALIYAYNILLQNQENEELRIKAHLNLLGELARQMNRGAMLPTPMVDVNNVLPKILDPEKLKEGDTFTLPEDVRLRVDEMEDAEGKHWYPLFLSREVTQKGRTANVVAPVLIRDIVRMAIDNPKVEGIVINPFGPALPIPKHVLEIVWKSMEEGEKNG